MEFVAVGAVIEVYVVVGGGESGILLQNRRMRKYTLPQQELAQ